MITNNFTKRHNGPKDNEVKEMLQTIGFNSLDELIENTVPGSIRKNKALEL